MKKLITYLCAAVILLGLPVCFAEVPDYGNDHTLAQTIDPNGVYNFGLLSSSEDDDWFKFDIPGFTHLTITLGNQDANYKQVLVYYEDEFGDPIQFRQWWTRDEVISQTLFVEEATTIYLKVNYDAGGYFVAANILGTTPADSYSDDCASPDTIIVDTAATIGVLDHTDPFDVDWFTFETIPLHKYQVTVTQATNSSCYFETYDASCGRIYGGTRSLNVTSWDGEDYKLYVYGSPSSVGEYYTIQVTDVGTYTDDVSNYSEYAETVPTDGTEVVKQLEYYSDYHKDQDWFTFTPPGNMKVRISMNDEEDNYKWLGVYQEDELGNLEYIRGWWSRNEVRSETLFIESDRTCYINVYGDTNVVGSYGVAVQQLEIRPPDRFSNSCTRPTTLTVGSPVTGTLDSTVPYDVDWFEFATEQLHKYQITLENLNNTNVYFELYSDNCDSIYGNATSLDVTSWAGENFKLYVNGNSAAFGNYYTLTVTEVDSFTDDFPNTAATAAAIVKDGSFVDGNIDYYSTVQRDEDWFTFVAGLEGTYEFVLDNPESNYKRIDIYKEDSVGNLVSVGGTWTNNSAPALSYTLPAGKSYVKVYGDTNITGGYRVSVLSPEPRCGDLDHPHPTGDVNEDCYVDMIDVADMARSWMECTSPEPPCNYLP